MPDAGAKRLDDGVLRLAREATETAAAVPRTDYAAESIGHDWQSANTTRISGLVETGLVISQHWAERRRR